MNHFAEKRDFQRIQIDTPARFRLAGTDRISSAVVKNLSSTGLLMLFEANIEPGTQLTVKITPAKNITPPFSAEVSVIRCDPSESGDYAIACSIERILPESDAGPDFP